MYRAETRQTNLCCFCHIYTSLLSVFQLNVTTKPTLAHWWWSG